MPVSMVTANSGKCWKDTAKRNMFYIYINISKKSFTNVSIKLWTHYLWKLKNIFFLVMPMSLHDEMGRPIRFELRSHAQSSCCCTKRQEWWRDFENQCKHTPKKSIPRKMLSYHWYLRTDLPCVPFGRAHPYAILYAYLKLFKFCHK